MECLSLDPIFLYDPIFLIHQYISNSVSHRQTQKPPLRFGTAFNVLNTCLISDPGIYTFSIHNENRSFACFATMPFTSGGYHSFCVVLTDTVEHL